MEQLLLIAGTQSGCGKTTVTLALMQYFRAQNMSVAPFKAGPDFLDPMWHTIACDRTSYNLDTRMIGEDACRELFSAQSNDAEISVIEGVMGMFDGVSGVGGEGSSAHLAKVLNEPIMLVVSAKGMSGSIVPLVEGFVARAKAMGANLLGIVANHVGSERHAMLLREFLDEYDLPPLMAWMQKGAPELPERHLGLLMPDETVLPDFSEYFHIEKEFPITTPPPIKKNQPLKSKHLDGRVVAVAKDEAFCFIYPANIEWLQAEGAEVVFFSPLAGDSVPKNTDALWLPGGYPELHVEVLSKSISWDSIADFIEAGNPVLAECGGMMALGQSIDGYAMAKVLQCSFMMQDKLAGLGYREDASGIRGHEFHHSKRECHQDVESCFDVKRGDAGIRYKNVRASYIHWYFGSQGKVVADWFGAVHGD
ncbi:MAG: cobyrinate a,c-diamide synthase [Mariprofundaceae bacterium]